MKLELNERTLNAYINEAINEELDEFLGLSRKERNAKWGYTWDPTLSAKQNRLNRNINKAQIKAKGYRNYDEYMAGEAPEEGQEQQGQEQVMPQFVPGQPAPFANERNRVGQFQTWYNQNMGGKLVVDGIWGKYTQAAWDQWVNQNFGGAE